MSDKQVVEVVPEVSFISANEFYISTRNRRTYQDQNTPLLGPGHPPRARE